MLSHTDGVPRPEMADAVTSLEDARSAFNFGRQLEVKSVTSIFFPPFQLGLQSRIAHRYVSHTVITIHS